MYAKKLDAVHVVVKNVYFSLNAFVENSQGQ